MMEAHSTSSTFVGSFYDKKLPVAGNIHIRKVK